MENGVKLNYESLAVKQTSKKNVTNMYLLKIFHSLSGFVRPKKKKNKNNLIQWFYRKCKCIIAHAYPPTPEPICTNLQPLRRKHTIKDAQVTKWNVVEQPL